MEATPHPAQEPNLTPTGRAILGVLSLGVTSGYDIKQLVDKSTRHFWAASYGGIYPELKRLETQGLVRGHEEPTGGRARRVYELTESGHAALASWLSSEREPIYELRDEGMLKLFFSDALPEQRLNNIRAMRRRMEHKLEQLLAVKAHAHEMAAGPALTLDLGVTTTTTFIQWCEAVEARLAEKE